MQPLSVDEMLEQRRAAIEEAERQMAQMEAEQRRAETGRSMPPGWSATPPPINFAQARMQQQQQQQQAAQSRPPQPPRPPVDTNIWAPSVSRDVFLALYRLRMRIFPKSAPFPLPDEERDESSDRGQTDAAATRSDDAAATAAAHPKATQR